MYLKEAINFKRNKGFLIALLSLSFTFSCSAQKGKDETKEAQTLSVGGEVHVKETAKRAANTCLYNNEVSTLGLGLVMPPGKFYLFKDSLLAEKYSEIDMYSESSLAPHVCSKFFAPDYGIMHFICIEVLDKSTLTKVLKTGQCLEFLTLRVRK